MVQTLFAQGTGSVDKHSAIITDAACKAGLHS